MFHHDHSGDYSYGHTPDGQLTDQYGHIRSPDVCPDCRHRSGSFNGASGEIRIEKSSRRSGCICLTCNPFECRVCGRHWGHRHER